jgi:hypothetical protein
MKAVRFSCSDTSLILASFVSVREATLRRSTRLRLATSLDGATFSSSLPLSPGPMLLALGFNEGPRCFDGGKAGLIP